MNSIIIIYIILGCSTFLNIVVPISGSSTVMPLLATLTDPHRAIGLASFFFLLAGIIRIFFFRKNIIWHEVRGLLPVSLLMAFVGSYSLLAINEKILLLIILLVTSYFFVKKIRNMNDDRNQKKDHCLYRPAVGIFSGFLQGAGFPGSDVRNSYLYSRGLTLSELHGTSSFIGTSIFSLATIVRLSTGQLTVSDISPFMYLFPIMIVATYVGRHVLHKMNKRISNIVILLVMAVSIIIIGIKII
jgi:uncharacterized protein